VHVDAEIVHHLGEGVDLFDTRKLGFVDHEDIDAVATEPLDMWREVCAGRDRLGAGLDADTTRYHSIVASVAERPQSDVASTLAQLPTVATPASTYPPHGPVGKGEFWHGPLVVDSKDYVTALVVAFWATTSEDRDKFAAQ